MADYSPTIFRLIEYEIWCNLRMMDFLSSMSEEEYRQDFDFGLRTPHRTMAHIADVMKGWSGSVGPAIEAPVWPAYDEDEFLQSIRKRIVEAGDAWLKAAKASHEQGLLGDERRLHQVFHLVTHGTHHRGQLLSMITLMGYDQPLEGGDFGGWSNVKTKGAR
jgi:uncharacterized damage-inducible protein DinB